MRSSNYVKFPAHRRIIVFSAFFLAAIRCVAQDIEPYDIPVDARSAALGESFAAVANTPAALFYNVAGLAQQSGIAAQYGSRVFPSPFANDAYASAAAAFGSRTFGTAGIYAASRRLNSDTLFHGALIPAAYDETSYIVSAGYANRLSPTMDAGIAFGYTRRSITGVTGSAAYLDFGVRYHESLLKSNVPDEFSFGVSVNNVGSPISYNDASGTEEDLPRSLRAGIAWRIAQPDTTRIANQFLSLLIAGQYKNVLNQQNTSSKGYWSLGIEAGAWNALFFRYGLQYRPYNSVYSYADNAQRNIGGGVQIPLHRLFGFSTPAYIAVDYAAVYLLDGSHEDVWTAGVRIDDAFVSQTPAHREDQ